MLAAYMKNAEDILLRDDPPRDLGPGQIRLQVAASGICGTDILAAQTGSDEYQPFGHEVAGEIVELGPGVTTLQMGQKVVLDSATPCGSCSMCKNAKQELCTDIQSFFFLNSFGMAQEMIAPAISAIPYDARRLSPAVASLQEPLGVALDVVRVADIRPGDNVLIMGPGPIGLMAIRLARLAGADRIFVTALSATSKRNQIALEFGADAVIEVDRVSLADYVFGCSIERVVSTTPPPTLETVIPLVAKGAIVAFIGLAYNDDALMSFKANEFHFKKIQLRASFASPALYGPKALRLLTSGKIDGDKLVSHTFSLKDLKAAMQMAVNEPGQTVKLVIEVP